MPKTGYLDLVAIKENTSFHDVLNFFDLTPEKPGTKQVKISCPFHDDNTPSLSINLEKGIYKCFGCGASGNVLDFIAEMEDYTDNPTYQAARKALEIIGRDAADFQGDNGSRPARKAGDKKKKPAGKEKAAKPKAKAAAPPEPAKTSNEPINIDLTLHHEHPFLEERNVSPDVAETYGIGYCGTGIMKGRIATPIHNLNGELVAFTGRWADEENCPDKEPRYKLPKGFEKSLELYNIHRAAAFGKPYVVIVEGIWSAIRLTEAGIPCVALLGTDVSEAQAGLLVAAGFRHAVLILDGDEAGRLATPAALTVLSPALYVKTIILDEGVKPDTMDEAIVERLRR